MFEKFDENPVLTLQDTKEAKRYEQTDPRTHGQRENSKPTTNKVCGGIMKKLEWSQDFPIITPWEPPVAMETRVLIRSSQTQCSHSPTRMILQMRFEDDRPAVLRDIHV